MGKDVLDKGQLGLEPAEPTDDNPEGKAAMQKTLMKDIVGKTDNSDDDPSPDDSDDDKTTDDPGADDGDKTPDKLKGKTAEELIKINAELEKKLGEQGEAIGTMKSDMRFLQSLVQDPSLGGPPGTNVDIPVVDPAVGKTTDDSKTQFDYMKPDESVKKIVEGMLKSKDTRAEAEKLNDQAQEAKSNFYEGKAAALSGNPELYEGIEKQVEAAVYQGYRAGLINYRKLNKPKTWERVAKLIHMDAGNLDALKKTIEPMKPTVTEDPTSTTKKTKEPSYDFDEKSRRIMKDFGMDEEEAVKRLEDLKKFEGGVKE